MLNEKDISNYTSEFADLQPEAAQKQLYELPRGSVFKLNDYEYLIKFHRTDGAYSYCTIAEGPDKNSVVHLAVWALVHPWSKQGNRAV